MYRIKRAHLADCDTLAGIWEEAVTATHDFLAPGDFDFYRSALPSYFDGLQLFTFEYTSGKIAGFAGIRGDKLEMLFVGERGKGIGKILLDFAVKERYVTKVDVNAQNTAAAEFYRKYGFKETGLSPFDTEGKPYPIIRMEIESVRPQMPHGHPGDIPPHAGGHPHGHPGGHGHGNGNK